MAQTVVGLYDNFSDAQAAVQALVNGGISRDHISLIAHREATGYTGNETFDTSDGSTVAENAAGEGAKKGTVIGGLAGVLVGLGFLAIPGVGPLLAAGPLLAGLTGAGLGAATGGLIGGLTHAGIPETDAQHYVEGVRRGGTLVTVRTDNAQTPMVEEILNRYHPVNIDERGNDFRSTGYTGYNTAAPALTGAALTAERARYTAPTPAPAKPAVATTGMTGAQEVIPVVEEQISVGKRTVQGGGVRVHTHVTETPVSEQVTLHNEQVTVERRVVDRPVGTTDANGTLLERTVEVTEMYEVPVVSKEARVVEEVVIGKKATDRVETVTDTVRRTDVEVENVNETTSTTGTTGTGNTGRTSGM